MRIYHCLLVLVLAAGPATAREDIERHPGYVDFGLVTIPEAAATSVEVYLKRPLLRMVSAATRATEPELAEMIDGLDLIRVHAFAVAPEDLPRVGEEIDMLAATVEEGGWERVAHIREQDELVHVYLKSEGDQVDGLLVMGFEEGDQAVFVNIVGDIDPAQIGRLGSTLHISPLDSLQLGTEDMSTSSR